MDDALAVAYRQTDYRVRRACGGYERIRIGAPLSARLLAVVRDAHWGIITAWNPDSRRTETKINRAAQRRLVAELRNDSSIQARLAAVGKGTSGWFEPSIFVVGITPTHLQHLCERYGQCACVTGEAGEAARLLWANTP